MYNKPEGAAAMEKEKAKYLDESNFKIKEDGVNSKGNF